MATLGAQRRTPGLASPVEVDLSATVDIRHLRKRFGRVVACDDLNMHLSGGVVGLLGPNGAGKTSVLSMLSGDLRPDSGSVLIDGHDVATAQGRRGVRGTVGYLPQRFDLAGGMRVVDVVRYAAWCNGVVRTHLDGAASDAMELVSLSDRAGSHVRVLSGGQRQRLGLAASVAHRPRLVLLDEPTAGYDPEQRRQFRQAVSAMASRATVVLATHLLEDIRHTANRLLVFDRGRVAFDGSAAALAQLGISDRDATAESDLESGYRAALAALRRGDLE